MKFSCLTSAGIFCIYGCGHTTGRLVLSDFCDCTEESGYVYLMNMRDNEAGSLTFDIIGSSGLQPNPNNKIDAMRLTVNGQQQLFREHKRYPVRDCLIALTGALINLAFDGFGTQTNVALGKRTRYYTFTINEDRYYAFLFAVEQALEPLAQVSIPPDHWLDPCMEQPGYIHLYFLHVSDKLIKKYDDFYCIRVFGSSNEILDPLSIFSVISLPLKRFLDGSRISVYHVKNCTQAADRLSNDYFVNHYYQTKDLCGQFCFIALDLEKDWNDLNRFIDAEADKLSFSNYQPGTGTTTSVQPILRYTD